MNDAKKAALAAIDEKKELVAEVADAIWDYAELSMQEVKSAALFVKVLKAEGFQVEEGICGIPTAFLRLLRQRWAGHWPAGGVRCAVRPFAGGGQHRVPRAGEGRQRPRLRPQSAGRGGHGRRHRPEALSDPDRKKRHRHPVRLPLARRAWRPRPIWPGRACGTVWTQR